MAYNPIYERLVRDEDDLIGIVAYGLYKQSKREWIQRYAERHEGCRPSPEHLMDYVDRYSESDLGRFRDQAEDMMLRFAEVIIEDRAPAIRQEALVIDVVSRFDQISALVRDNGSTKKNVVANIYANLILGGVTFLLVIGVYLSPNIPDLAKKFVSWVTGG